MGFFGKLFEKKECSICGGEIGLLGNRKLEDGNCCKTCANKLSPWFDDRRHSTVAQIQEQLAYREANQTQVEQFNITRTIGEKTFVYLDENQGKFMVTNRKDREGIQEENPDVLDCTQVVGCDLDIDETRSEEKYTNKDGEYVSYSPPRYTYSYNFDLIIRVKHPYFDEIKFRLNDWSVESRPTASFGLFGASSGNNKPYEYDRYVEMGREIKEALLNARQQSRDEARAAAAPKAAVICACCGATTIPDANGCCEYCGGAARG